MGELAMTDFRLEAYPIEGIDPRGGQHAGAGHPGVRVTHIPSGQQAYVNVCRSQHKNKAIAVDMVMSAITHPFFPEFAPAAQRASKEGRPALTGESDG